MASKAYEKRFEAIRAISDKYRPESNGYMLIDDAKVEDMISDIEALFSLGRTERWHNSLKRWIDMLNEYPGSLDWAILQGGVFAAYAAE
jgi:hypothetical protein